MVRFQNGRASSFDVDRLSFRSTLGIWLRLYLDQALSEYHAVRKSLLLNIKQRIQRFQSVYSISTQVDSFAANYIMMASLRDIEKRYLEHSLFIYIINQRLCHHQRTNA